jgi:hypothetical protein
MVIVAKPLAYGILAGNNLGKGEIDDCSTGYPSIIQVCVPSCEMLHISNIRPSVCTLQAIK